MNLFEIRKLESYNLKKYYRIHITVKPIMDTLLGGHLHLADIFLGPIEYNGLNILKSPLNGHSIKWTQIL